METRKGFIGGGLQFGLTPGVEREVTVVIDGVTQTKTLRMGNLKIEGMLPVGLANEVIRQVQQFLEETSDHTIKNEGIKDLTELESQVGSPCEIPQMSTLEIADFFAGIGKGQKVGAA